MPLAARPVPPIGTHCSGRRVGPFVYPGRRVRRKATPVSQELEELAQAAEAQTAVLEDGTNDEMDFEAALLDTAADEEAAHALGKALLMLRSSYCSFTNLLCVYFTCNSLRTCCRSG